MKVALLVHGTGVHVELRPGAKLLAVDARLLRLRPLLAMSIGLDAHAAVDDALGAISTRAPLLVVGPRGLAEDAWLDELSDDTLRVDLDRERITAPRAASIFASDRRVVFRAAKAKRAVIDLDSHIARVRTVVLAPLVERMGEVPRMLDAIVRELGEAHGVEAFKPELLVGVGRYTWPRGVDELREHARRLVALHRCGSVRAAARSLGVAHQTLAQHLARVSA